MMHSIHTLSIRKYGIIDHTENLSLLKRWYNPFPVHWFNIEKVINNFAQQINSGVDIKIITEIGKSLFFLKVQKAQALYQGVYNLLVLKTDNDQWGKTKKREGNLSEYLRRIKDDYGFDIANLSDLNRFNKDILRMIDKYAERYPNDVKPKKAIPFTQYAYSVFSIMEMDYNPEMLMVEFLDLTKVANEKAKFMEKQKIKYGKHK